eukprot:TRINITY_DN29983_c0_g1_i1.p1 TRINITY_DN29983_c0_g1~~TRINITY_DN29983_c0_g1_i1.p1  ORF type:complete len:483 (+),score=85.30 TRINITY_DN29983_c0_g1_i1:133-1449(+)
MVACGAAARELGGQDKLPTACFYYAGISVLLGWNMVLSFSHFFDCGMFGGQEWGGSGFPFWCTLAYSSSNPLVQVMLASRRVLERFSFDARWCVGIVGSIVALLGLTACQVWTNDTNRDFFFVVALAFTFLLGSSSAIFQSSCFALAGAISPTLMQVLMTGQGIAGVMAGLIGYMFNSTPTLLVVSFVLTACFNLLGIPLYFFSLKRNPLVCKKLGRLGEDQAETPLDSPPYSSDSLPSSQAHRVSSPMPSPCSSQPIMRRRSSTVILKESTWPQALTVGLVFLVTFVVFPGVTTKWRPDSRVSSVISTFQLFDVAGRSAPMISAFQVKNGRLVSLMAVLRILFVPAFMLVERGEGDWATSAFLQYALMMSFAFSNGYVSTLSMMLGPAQSGIRIDEKEPAGALMSFFLVLGIFLGSLLALPTQIGIEQVPNCPTTIM